MHRRWIQRTLLGLALVGLGACGGSEGGDLEVTNINPRAGATSGEQAVQILGNNFRQDIGYTVYFGTKRSERATILDEHTLVVATPMMDDPGAVDVVIAAEDATFALTEVKLGLAAAIISLTVHARMTPRAAALTTLGGEVFSGGAAAAYGLVTKAVPADRLAEEVATVCASLATGAPQGLRESKRILNRDLLARIDAYGEEMSALSARLFASEEARTAMAAFLSRKR